MIYTLPLLHPDILVVEHVMIYISVNFSPQIYAHLTSLYKSHWIVFHILLLSTAFCNDF